MALLRERLRTARPPALAIELHTDAALQGEQAVADALFGNVQHPGGAVQTALSRQLDKGGDLIGRQGEMGSHERKNLLTSDAPTAANTNIALIERRINNYLSPFLPPYALSSGR